MTTNQMKKMWNEEMTSCVEYDKKLRQRLSDIQNGVSVKLSFGFTLDTIQDVKKAISYNSCRIVSLNKAIGGY